MINGSFPLGSLKAATGSNVQCGSIIFREGGYAFVVDLQKQHQAVSCTVPLSGDNAFLPKRKSSDDLVLVVCSGNSPNLRLVPLSTPFSAKNLNGDPSPGLVGIYAGGFLLTIRMPGTSDSTLFVELLSGKEPAQYPTLWECYWLDNWELRLESTKGSILLGTTAPPPVAQRP